MGDSVQDPYRGSALDLTGRLTSPDPLAMSNDVNPLHCKIMGSPG